MLDGTELYRNLLEIIVCAVTFIGILAAFDNRIVNNYKDLIEKITERVYDLNTGIKYNIFPDNDQIKEQILYFQYTIGNLTDKSQEYKYMHMMLTVIGAIFLLGYAFIVTIEYIPTPIVFFISWVMIIIGMSPSICYLLKHRNMLYEQIKLQSAWNDVFAGIKNELAQKNPDDATITPQG